MKIMYWVADATVWTTITAAVAILIAGNAATYLTVTF